MQAVLPSAGEQHVRGDHHPLSGTPIKQIESSACAVWCGGLFEISTTGVKHRSRVDLRFARDGSGVRRVGVGIRYPLRKSNQHSDRKLILHVGGNNGAPIEPQKSPGVGCMVVSHDHHLRMNQPTQGSLEADNLAKRARFQLLPSDFESFSSKLSKK